MNVEVKMSAGAHGLTEINLSLPTRKANAVFEAIRNILPLAGLKVRRVNEDGEVLFSAEDVFPDGSPAMALRGLRVKEDLTQQELADHLKVSLPMIIAMESGHQKISLKMAKRIAEIFNVPYQAFV